MEQLNHVELRGNVGSITINEVGEKKVAHVSLATNYVYKGKDGNPIIETSWHNVTIWEGRIFDDLSKITKGGNLYVMGRLKSGKYKSSDNIERTSYEIIANQVTISE